KQIPSGSSVWKIYSISELGALLPFYIGQTVNLPRRIKEHLSARAKASSAAKIAAMMGCDELPVFRILATCHSRAEADAQELRGIAHALANGACLENAKQEMRAAQKLPKP
ncbi:MAG: GIY-YIG nuclease family protein, partial [Verrucomicrobiota bacterium]